MRKTLFIDIITYAFVILFVYTALSKWFLYRVYLEDLQRSPDLGSIAIPLSLTVPASELVVAGLLLFERTRLKGMYGSLILMTVFTIYVGWVLVSNDSYPCTCGGIIREMSWRHHMIFNVVFTFLAGLGIYLIKKQSKGVSGSSNTFHRITTPV